MKTLHHLVAGEPVTINVVETAEDLYGFIEFINRNLAWLAVDSETTGLDIYSDGFRCRVVQFGNTTESWVIPVERGDVFRYAVQDGLRVNRLIFQNASYDLQVFDRCFGIKMESLWPKVIDTKILAHLVDPRGKDEGGTGHSLEDLTRYYLDAEVADSVKGSMKLMAASEDTPMKDVWANVSFDNPTYQLYAGMDTILAARLAQKLKPMVPTESLKLIRYEHSLAEVCSIMERTGFLLDQEYTENLSDKLKVEELRYVNQAKAFGCDNVNSTAQVAAVLVARGVTIPETTPTGNPKVDKKLLDSLVAQGDPFGIAVHEAKKARKWRNTWVDGFLAQMDSSGRCHPSINPLRARTARMSITGIPAQTLPAGDSTIRRCFVSDPGELIASVDYQTQELRVLAVLSNDPTMKAAFRNGDDLHQITADASGVSRKVGKMVNFAYVYGSGPANLAYQMGGDTNPGCGTRMGRQMHYCGGCDVDVMRRVIQGFEQSYPRVKEYATRLQRIARQQGYITTPMGRRLPVDPTRAYSALNYMVQSASRDVTASGLLRLHKAGFTPYLRLPIHDEVLVSLPADKAEWGAKRIGELMSTTFEGVRIGTDPEVGKRSWGSLYGSDY